MELDRGLPAARLQMRCEHGGQGLDARTLCDWEDRGHTPSAVYRPPLCACFDVDSIAELGLGQGLAAAANWTCTFPPEGQAWLFALLALLALERAAVGDDLGSGRLLEQARTAAARIRGDGAGWGYWSAHGALSGWDGVRLESFAGVRSLRLGRPADAVEFFDAAAGGVTVPFRRAQLWVDMTDARVALGEPEGACAAAMAGLDEADAHGLGISEVRRARAAFPRPWRTLAPVVELDERLALSN
ncbi:MAG: hypothetical protein ACRD0K_14325 [Egibacteraceae bacterium]